MSTGRSRLLVVDDSALMRRLLRQVFEEAGRFELAFARNGREALEEAARFRPDVITLDVNMPELDGLSALERLMAAEGGARVVMVSSLTEEGAEVTLRALELGALDFVPKPDGTVSLSIDRIRDTLLAKVRAAAVARPPRARGLTQRLRQQREARRTVTAPVARGPVPGLVLVGVSTGGPRTLEAILPLLPADFPWPVLVAQHMPASFTGVFARRMDGLCALQVTEVGEAMPLAPGHIYIGRGDADLVVARRLGRLVADSVPADASLWHPSADRLVASAMEALPAPSLVGVLLTGMGHDGAAQMAALRQRGGRTIAESEGSAVVFGMPAELIRRNGANVVQPADDVARQLMAWCRRG